MGIHQAVMLGVAGNEMSKEITGTNQASVGRSAVATTAGVTLGAAAAGTIALTGVVAAAPIMIPLAVGAGAVSFIASLFD